MLVFAGNMHFQLWVSKSPEATTMQDHEREFSKQFYIRFWGGTIIQLAKGRFIIIS